MKSVALLIVGLLISLINFSQIKHPKNGKLFNDTLVHKIEIQIDTADLSTMRKNLMSNDQYSITFIIHYPNKIDTLTNVGIRPKGNFSRTAPKTSYKISFNTYTKGAKYKGLEKLNLSAYTNDPTHLRSHLAADLFTHAGLASVRSSHANLYVNGTYYGLFNVFEHIDEEFIGSRFGSKKGNLYKCQFGANLIYLGEDVNKYDTVAGWRRQVYELKTNKEAYDFSGFIEFLNILSNTPAEEFEEKLEARFNVEDYLKTMAIEVLIGHWDGAILMGNNFYLYDNPKTGKFEFISYDFDNTFGIDWFGFDLAKRDIYNWGEKVFSWQPDSINDEQYEETKAFHDEFTGDSLRPIYYNLLAVDKYRNQFNYHLNSLITNRFNVDSLQSEIDLQFKAISPYLETDTSDNFSWEDIQAAVEGKIDAHIMYGDYKHYFLPYGIKSFIETKDSVVRATLEPIKPMITLNHVSEKKKKETTIIRVKVEGDKPEKVSLFVWKKKNKFQEYTMYDDGLNGDKRAGDSVYSYQISKKDLKGKKYYISTTQSDDVLVREPFAGYFNN